MNSSAGLLSLQLQLSGRLVPGQLIQTRPRYNLTAFSRGQLYVGFEDIGVHGDHIIRVICGRALRHHTQTRDAHQPTRILHLRRLRFINSESVLVNLARPLDSACNAQSRIAGVTW